MNTTNINQIICTVIAAFTLNASAGELVKEVNFDTWEAVPITDFLAERIKSFKEQDCPLPLEIQGPTYMAFMPSWGIPGIMVPENEAVKGNAVVFKSGAENYSVGEHIPFGAFLDPEKEYRYEIFLRGNGKFNFSAWLAASNAEGEIKTLGLAPLIEIPVEDGEWQKYEGTFKVPENTDTEYSTYNKLLLGGIVIPANATIYVDEFRIYEN